MAFTLNKKNSASALKSLSAFLACSIVILLLSGCSRPTPEYPLNTDNSRILETTGLAEVEVEADQSSDSSVTNSMIFSSLGFQKTGRFIETTVSGLGYTSISNSGITGTDGSFQYNEGEMISFHIGNIKIGQIIAKEIVTPLDLTPANQEISSDNIMLTNILQLLQTLDSDGDASNGVTIGKAVTDAAAELTGTPSINSVDFTENQELLIFVSSITNTSNFISANQALENFETYFH